MVVRRAQSGFTLLEMMVASAIAGVAIAAAFTFASYQVRSYAQQQDVQDMSVTNRVLLDSVIEDIRGAGYGTSYYAGVGVTTAFGGRAVMADGGGPLGVPALAVSDQVTAPLNAAPGLGVMQRSDAITLLRVEGEATYLPSSGAGIVGLPPAPGAGPHTVANQAALVPCAQGNGSHLVLISDMMRHGEPASMLMELTPAAGWVPAGGAGLPGEVRFVNGNYGIDPASAGAPGALLPAGRVFGPGSIVVCVRLVTYWLDNIGRLRVWEGRANNVAAAVNLNGQWPFGTNRPVNPAQDAVVAENIADFQVELYNSGMAPFRPTAWMLDTPPNAGRPPQARQISEVRAVRITAMLRTPIAGEAKALNVPAAIANHNLILANYPNTHTYRLVSYTAELRNMRHFDLMSSNARAWNQVRSFP